MIKSILGVLWIVLACSYAGICLGQDVPALFKQAETFEKTFREEEALLKYEEIIRKEPANIDALCKASELYNIVGKRYESKTRQKEYFSKGKQLAQTALKLNPNHSEANFAMAISMGRMALISSGQEKIKAVRDIKLYADKSVSTDPKNYKGYYLIGRWNYDVSDLSSIEKWLVKVSFGALPPSSLSEAIKNYQKSMRLNPSFILNYLELARAYKRNDETPKARQLLQQMQRLPPASTEDIKIKGTGKKMLDDL